MSKWERYRDNVVLPLWFEKIQEPEDNGDLIVAALGLAGETGELIEVVKKGTCRNVHDFKFGPGERIYLGDEGDVSYLAKDKTFDRDKFLSEAGDVFWYYTLLIHNAGYTLDEVISANEDKLFKRHAV